mgnify:CR=1 FL=1
MSDEEKQAIEILNIAIGKRKGVHVYQNELTKAIETVLSILEQQDKIIDLMAGKIYEEGIVWNNKEEVKQYFENKAKELLNK